MAKIEEVTLNGEKVYLRKNVLGWKVVYPYQKEYNEGKFNWRHFIAGRSWWNLVFVAGIVFLLIMSIVEYYEATKLASACLRALPDNIDLNLYLKNPSFIGVR